MFEPWVAALDGLERDGEIEVLYWLDRSARSLVRQSPRDDDQTRGTFALRSPLCPNPIGTQIVTLLGIEGPVLHVRGLDCVDGTPLLDLKPDRRIFTPLPPPPAHARRHARRRGS